MAANNQSKERTRRRERICRREMGKKKKELRRGILLSSPVKTVLAPSTVLGTVSS